VRWFNGYMGPIGGWVARTTVAMTGKPRAILNWLDNSIGRWIAVGTEQKLYAFGASSTTASDITPSGFTTGNASATSGGGYGAGLYGAGLYGTPRLDNISVIDASMWTFDTFGQYLLACMAEDGRIYQWTLDTGVAAAALSGAPTDNQAVMVTAERFVFALGAGDNPRKVQWSDQEASTTWTPTATNQAGDFDLQTVGRIMCGKRTVYGAMIWTDLDVHLASYIGLPYVYRVERAGTACGAVSRGCCVVTDTRVYWMGLTGFFYFDGAVSPLPCEIYDAVFGNLNLTQRSKIVGFHNSRYSEIWWFYPTEQSTENDVAAVYNYQENTWNVHSLTRLAAVDATVFRSPMMTTSDGYVYDHEIGNSYSSATIYAETGPIEIADGNQLVKVREIIPDEVTLGDTRVRFYVKDWPTDSETTYGPYTLSAPTELRFAGRQVRMRVEGVNLTDWRIGAPRLDIVQGGRR
jgi:hypothetical protein